MAIVGYKYYSRNIRPYLEEPKKKSRTILGMTLFSLIVFGAFAIRPSISTISRLNREVKKAREAQTLLDKKINDLSQAQVNYQLALKDLELVNQALPKDTAVPAILETLALSAGRNNITLIETEFGKIGSDGLLKTLPLTVTVTGGLANIEAFITELENGLRQINVEQVRMDRGGDNPEHLVGKIECRTYFLSEVENE